MSIITMRSIFRKLLRAIVYALQNFGGNFRILWRHLQTDLQNI